MRRLAIALLMFSLIATPVYAVNVIDTVVCKKVVLRANNRTVLVNRVTGEVKYILQRGQWKLLTGSWKKECQLMYDIQLKRQKH